MPEEDRIRAGLDALENRVAEHDVRFAVIGQQVDDLRADMHTVSTNLHSQNGVLNEVRTDLRWIRRKLDEQAKDRDTRDATGRKANPNVLATLLSIIATLGVVILALAKGL